MFKLVTVALLAVTLHGRHVVEADYYPVGMGGGGAMMGGGAGMMGGGGVGMMGGGGAGMMGGGAGMMSGGSGMMSGGAGMMGGGAGMMSGGSAGMMSGGGGMMRTGMMGGGTGMMGGGGRMMGGAGMMGSPGMMGGVGMMGGPGMMGGGGAMMGPGMMGGGGTMMRPGMMGGGMMGGGMMGGGMMGKGMIGGPMGVYGGSVVDKGAFSEGKKNLNDLYYKKAQGSEGGQYDQGQGGYHKGEVAAKDVKGDSGYYNDINKGKKMYEDGKMYHGAKHYDKEGKFFSFIQLLKFSGFITYFIVFGIVFEHINILKLF